MAEVKDFDEFDQIGLCEPDIDFVANNKRGYEKAFKNILTGEADPYSLEFAQKLIFEEDDEFEFPVSMEVCRHVLARMPRVLTASSVLRIIRFGLNSSDRSQICLESLPESAGVDPVVEYMYLVHSLIYRFMLTVEDSYDD